MRALAVTFDRSPRQEAVLTPLSEKVALLRQAGADDVEVLTFTEELRSLTARQFMQWLRDRHRVRVLLTGYDNRFGHDRKETFADYQTYGRELGMDVIGLQADGDASSSGIRRLLLAGDVEEAARMLGRCYSISGSVEHGRHIGTGMGFPTANISPEEPRQLLPAHGAYAVRAYIDDDSEPHPAMMNIGHRPTFDGSDTTIEVHLLRHDCNLYGHRLTIEFIHWLRGEQHFASVDELRQQLQRDAEASLSLYLT